MLLQFPSVAPALALKGWENGIPSSLKAGIPVTSSGNIKKSGKLGEPET